VPGVRVAPGGAAHRLASMASPARTDLGGAIRLAVLRLSRRLRQESAGEVTPSQLSALTVLARHGEMTLGELAAIERIAPPSMTRIAARLEEAGLLERRPDASDRRVARVALSEAGRKLVAASRQRGDAFVSSRLQALTGEEREVLARAVPLLERLASEDG
jgi:DNA-binding MarR family transcriptional regulator